MFKCFVDDSGNSTNRPVLVMGGCVGAVQEWDNFADAWDAALKEAPAIDYYKHSEARAQEGCFKGVSASDAAAKTFKLASLIAKFDLTIFATHARRQEYDRLVCEHAIKQSGTRFRGYIRDPMFLTMQYLVSRVAARQSIDFPDDKVDFIIDGRPASPLVRRFVEVHDMVCTNSPEWVKAVMGGAFPMDDRDVLPLQAADLVAGQTRVAQENGRMEAPLQLLHLKRPCEIYPLHEMFVRIHISTYNLSISTDRLVKAKKEGKGDEKTA